MANRGKVQLAMMGLVLLAWVGPVPAQQTDQADGQAVTEDVSAPQDLSPEELGNREAAKLEDLRRTVVEERGYRERMAAASKEDSLVLRLQLAGAEDRFMADLKELHGMVTAPGGDQGDLRAVVQGVFVEVTPRLWEIMEELRATIDRLRARRTDTPPAGRLGLEEDIRIFSDRLNDFVRYGGEHLAYLESLGRPVEAERELFATILRERADAVSGRLTLAMFRNRELKTRLKTSPDDADLTLLAQAARKSTETNTAALQTTVAAMESLDLDTSRYREQLLTATQDLASGLRDVRLTMNLLRRALRGISEWFSSKGPNFLVKLLLFVAILFVGRLVARMVSRAVEKSLGRSNVKMSALLRRMTVSSTRNAILALALVLGLAQLGISLGPLLAGFGVIGFILGFAMQDSLGNLAAGMMILINRPYDVGDLVEISGVFGKVETMTMVSTSILTLDNQKLVVPNSKIWGDVIKNVTDQRIRRVDMVFGISYSDDIPHAEEVLKGILADHEKILADPEPVVRLHTLGDSSVDFVVRPWVPTAEYWNVYWDVTRAVKMRFDEEGISIPFPQRDVHLYEQKKIPAPRRVLEDVEQEPVDASGTTPPGEEDD